jgi:hypothetical protein
MTVVRRTSPTSSGEVVLGAEVSVVSALAPEISE